jgi:putative heme-binding domain-containing protein
VVPLLRVLLDDPALRRPALRGLAAFADPATPALLLKRYPSFSEPERADAVATLASRPAYARALLSALEKGRVRRRDVSAFTARQVLALHEPDLTARLNKVWGSIRPTSADKGRLLARYLKLVPPDRLKKANRGHGRAVFARTCAACHTLFDAGGKVGPELTGSQRANPEYLLSKLLDPNAAVAQDYQVTTVRTSRGRTISGIVKQETDRTLTLVTQNEEVRLPKRAIEERRKTKVSMMPEGLLAPLSEAEVRDLIAYLAGPNQVPLPPGGGKKPRPKR